MRSHSWLFGMLGAIALGLGDRFEVAASMTAGDAYDVAPFVIEGADAGLPRLVSSLLSSGLAPATVPRLAA